MFQPMALVPKPFLAWACLVLVVHAQQLQTTRGLQSSPSTEIQEATGSAHVDRPSRQARGRDAINPSKSIAKMFLALNRAAAFNPSRSGACLPLGVHRPLGRSSAVMNMDDPVAQVFSQLFAGGSGKQIFFGVFQRDVDASSIPSDQERATLRAEAAASLTNIDMSERDRRRLAGTVMSVLTAGLAVGLIVGQAPTLTRFAIAPPLFLSYGFLASAKSGL
mmetsp:Transcript_15543/g.27634  ORF Transcript_15543/g.27634 Transcript_15543/m.27634 type:complete len:220 (+) Transcript_15543:58-717(+)